MALEQLTLETKQNKVEVAISLLQAWEPPEGYYLAFSGGKDSMVIFDLAVKAGVKFDAHYCVSPIDPPQIHKFIRERYPDVTWDYHARGWWKIVVKKGLPLRQARWCCSIIKESGGNERVKVLGMRQKESSGRRGYCTVTYPRRHPDSVWILPIVTWDEYDIWSYIKKENLPYCSLYDEGFTRLGCVLCPFSSKVDLEIKTFPKIAKLWLMASERIVERRLAEGKGFSRGFTTGQQLFDWWISRSK